MRKWFCVAGALILLLGCSAKENQCPPLFDGIGTSVHIYDRRGKPLRDFLSEQETYIDTVTLSEVSSWLILAVIAAEDRRFYTHHGTDMRAVLRALWQNIRSRRVVSGASTITQQVARMRHPRAKNLWNKLVEMYEAHQLEKRYSKEEILEQYFNLIAFGNLTQGVQAASRFYFGLPAAELSLGQSALLASLIQAPTTFNPLKNPSGALARRNKVLASMLQTGAINKEQYRLSVREPLDIRPAERPFTAPHFARLIYSLAPQAQQVHTFLDTDLQRYAEASIRQQLARLQQNNVTNAAVVVLDNQTGGVLAYVGSADFGDTQHSGQVDGVSAKRQPGSALKPFVYALALQNGLTAGSLLQDEDTFFEGGFRPRNYDEKFHGAVSVRRALACSYNVPVIKAAEPLGAARILQFLWEMGFVSLNRPPEFYGLAIALGGGEVTLLELANAYATLARGGIFKPVVFAQEPYLAASAQPHRVLPETVSYIITDILADNTARAPAFGVNSALHFTFPAAAKTGTSKDYKDNFAIGYTPRITVAVWVGNFDASSMQKVSGITGAGPILHDVLSYANSMCPGGEFIRPHEVVSARICNQSGLLAGPACTHTQEELFAVGTEPNAICSGQHEHTAQMLTINSPSKGDVYVYDVGLPAAGQQLHFTASGGKLPCSWYLNEKQLSIGKADVWWPLQRGKFNLSVKCGEQTAQTSFEVL